MSTALISGDIKSLTWYGYDIMITWPNLGTVNTYRYAAVTYHARLVLSWLYFDSPKYEPWLNRTRLICRRSVPILVRFYIFRWYRLQLLKYEKHCSLMCLRQFLYFLTIPLYIVPNVSSKVILFININVFLFICFILFHPSPCSPD